MSAPTFPARLHVLLAQGGSRAVVLRRGPSKDVCLIAWDRGRDTFEEGQWLRGRIYERRCDLRISCPDWEWAERDRDDLLYTRGGCLYRVARPRAEVLGPPKLLRDFNAMKFVARSAPYR